MMHYTSSKVDSFSIGIPVVRYDQQTKQEAFGRLFLLYCDDLLWHVFRYGDVKAEVKDLNVDRIIQNRVNFQVDFLKLYIKPLPRQQPIFHAFLNFLLQQLGLKEFRYIHYRGKAFGYVGVVKD